MQHSPRSSLRRAPPAPTAILVAGAIAGLLVEMWAGGFDNPAEWVPDYLSGVGLLAAGAASMRLDRGTATLLALAAAAWWAGTVVPEAQYLHRIPLFHAIAAYPGWRLPSRSAGIALAAFYVAVATPALSRTLAGTAVYGLTVLGLAAFRYRQASPSIRRMRRTALLSSIALFVGTTGVGVIRLAISDGAKYATPALLIYETMVVVSGLILWTGLKRPTPEALADLVVELDETRASSLRNELRRLLGDPLLEILFRIDDAKYVTPLGLPVALPDPESDRTATPVKRDGRGDMVIVHDRSLLQSEDLLSAVESVTRLSRANATLLADTRDHLQALSESRDRLVAAEQEERLRLASELRRGVEASLGSIEHRLEDAVEHATTDRVRTAIGQALDQLRLTRQDLEAIAEGLHPQALVGPLEESLQTLTTHSSIPIEVTLPSADLSSAAKTAVYYLSAEALANLTKHANAGTASLTVTVQGDRVVWMVADDGVGGADLAMGSGLKGLAERVAALGGHLEVISPIGGGTRLVAEWPLGDQANDAQTAPF